VNPFTPKLLRADRKIACLRFLAFEVSMQSCFRSSKHERQPAMAPCPGASNPNSFIRHRRPCPLGTYLHSNVLDVGPHTKYVFANEKSHLLVGGTAFEK